MLSIKTYRADGTTRALWTKPLARVFREHHVMPERASHIVAITTGRFAGYFHADMSTLAALTHQPAHCICLGPFESHEEAVAAEQQWLIRHWVGETS